MNKEEMTRIADKFIDRVKEMRPPIEEVQKFSTDLGELIGRVDPVEAAYKAVVMQNYVDALKDDPISELAFQFASAEVGGGKTYHTNSQEEYAKWVDSIKKGEDLDAEEGSPEGRDLKSLNDQLDKLIAELSNLLDEAEKAERGGANEKRNL